MAKNVSFITLKDHKENFENNPKCRLINPAKIELGKVSKHILEKINKSIREATKVNQWHNSDDVIKWFDNIPNKSKCTFLQFDIEEFYPSISKDLLLKSLTFAEEFINIQETDKNIILHARKSLLFTNDDYWLKKSGDPNFDVTMGSFDGAELCELVGLFILYTLSKKYGIDTSGLYRDDGLMCFHNICGPQAERNRKDLIKLFKDEFNLKITTMTNLKIVNFLDITFDLRTGTYKPYSKPNDKPMYINVNSNHPPNIIKCLPKMIANRISRISSNKDIFDKAAPYYNEALKSSGYKDEIKYEKQNVKQKRTRSRKVIWFNPPFSINVKTNIARRFLLIVDKNFPNGHKFKKILNRNTLKVSYSCLPNMSSIISSHNKKVLNTKQSTSLQKTCNCRRNNECPLNGKCLVNSIIYKCHVKSSENDEGVHYIGLTEKSFKERWYSHKHDFRTHNKRNSTELSKHIWKLKDDGTQPITLWEIIDQAPSYRAGSKTCNLCLTEKFHIITSELKLVNKRSELISKCRHSNKFYLNNYKVVPPDGQPF